MNDFNGYKWPAVIFFVTCGLFFFGCVWYLWAGTVNPEYYWQSSDDLALESPEPFLEKNECVLLARNRGGRVNGARVVYRGSRNGALLLDLYVLQLDPHYGYSHKIEEEQARKGFRMGEEHYKVLAASDAKISLMRL